MEACRSCGLRSLAWEKLFRTDLLPACIQDMGKLVSRGVGDEEGGLSLLRDMK